MKTKIFLAVIAVVFLVGFVSSCTNTDTAETETLYEQSIDRRTMERAGDQGGD
ncbi:hypothetical protein [uncultured Maribacter sp.]|uniref:hypothetical protein n=1 Tax=uncultured Maribacter sp. TaxID=431308 RepID=UPI00260E97A3|nr:hypothetical protein [uncultured Maribacter sp.]